MVGEFDSHGLAGGFDAPGHFVIGETRGRIARRVVVDHDEGMGRVDDGATEDLGRIGERFVARAAEDFLGLDEAFAVVQQDDPHRFLAQALHFRSNEGEHVLRSGDGAFVVRLLGETPPEFEGGGELGRLRRADAGDLEQFRQGGARELPQTAESADQLPAEIDGADAGPPGAEKEGEDLGVTEGRRSPFHQFFARTIVLGHLLDPHENGGILTPVPPTRNHFSRAGRIRNPASRHQNSLQNSPPMYDSTIAAIASPPGVGAVALIRVSGRDAVAVAAKVFSGRPSSRWQPRCQHWGKFTGPGGETIDEGLLTYFPGPNSFTGEDVVEIGCHGGMLVTRRILEALLEAGAEAAAPGAFSQRAFLNGRIDLTQAEAIMDLISAQTDLAIRAAGQQLAGTLGTEIESIRKDLIALLAHVEAYIDFPEEDIDPDSLEDLSAGMDRIAGRLDHLLATADQGRILREGIRTVICGPPNAGKSSLLNRLLGFDRAIVSDLAGTTRDTIEEFINLKGIPLRLIDTAGLREGAGEIEREGIERTRAQIAGAELVLHVVDASQDRKGIEEITPPSGARLVRVLNKSDLPRHADWETDAGWPVSCLESDSVEAFRQGLYDLLAAGTGLASANLTAINARHQACLKQARRDLAEARNLIGAGESPEFVASCLHASLGAVGEVVGRTDIEEILGEIFSRFCIGK